MPGRLTWDEDGSRTYESGVDRGVVYPVSEGTYQKGEAWDGLISVSEQPSGAEPTKLYANNRKYGEILSEEEFGFSMEAYEYPECFNACQGVKKVGGAYVTGQTRQSFGMTYRSLIGNDTEGLDHAYKIHLVWGAKVKPSESANSTTNESPEAKTMSWEASTTPVAITSIAGMKPTSHIVVDSRSCTEQQLEALEDLLYGNTDADATLPTPDEVLALVGADAVETQDVG